MALAVAAGVSVGVAVGVWYALQPAPIWTGDAAGTATLRARDRTGERDAPTIVERLGRLGVHADARDVARDGATVEVSGAADVQRVVHAVLEPGRFAVYAEAPPVGPATSSEPAQASPPPAEVGGGALTGGAGDAAAGGAGDAAAGGASAEPTAPRSRVLEDCAQAPCAPVQVLLPATITNRELAGADRTSGGVALRLTADGALQLEALTQRTVGRRLVVAVDDRIYDARVVSARDHTGRLTLTLAPADADRLQASLAGNPLAGRWELVGLVGR